MIGTTVGPYRVLDKIGEGGMGEVYLADDERLHRRVALKVLPLEFVSDGDRVERFEREVRAVGALNHPNILTLFDLGRAGDQYFMATEFVDGRTLRAVMQERGALPLAEAIGIIVQGAEALACAHAAGIVHRDIKPENLMIRRDGYVKLLDFGLATIIEPSTSTSATTTIKTALTSAGMVLGTVDYLSPEQARAQSVDSRTDIFSLAVVLFEMLTGVRPFRGSTTTDTIAAILLSDPPPLGAFLADAPASLEAILARALAKDRDARYPTVVEFSRDLKALSADVALTPPSRPRRGASALPRPRRFLVAIVAAVPLAVAASGALWWNLATRKPPTTIAGTTTELPAIRTLAVLPFQLLGYPDASEHLGLGMADALIVKLTSLRQLTVRPTTAVLRYQTRDPDVVSAGRALQVDAVLTGNLQRDSGRTRVTVQLIRTGARADAATVWSDVFTASTDDPFEVQDQLAGQLVQKLALELTGDEQKKLTAHETSSPRARQLYMEGRFFMNKRSEAGFARAVELFEDALRHDPNYARAHYGRALARNASIELGTMSHTEMVPKVRDGLNRALELDPMLGEAYGLRSLTSRVYEWRFDQADRDSERSMDLDPNNPAVMQWRGVHLLALGRAQDAVSLHLRAVEIDPLDMNVRALLCRALYLARRYDDAIATSRELIALDQNQSAPHQWIGLSMIGLGRAEASLASLKQAVALSASSERTAALAYGYAVAGRPAEARKLIASLEASKAGVGNPYHLATVHTGLGERERALQWLDRALRDRDGFLPNRIKLDPKLDPLREEPRFQRLVEATLRGTR